MSIKPIDVKTAESMVSQGATLVDVRESQEFAAVHIPGSINVPLSRIAHGPLPAEVKKPIIFFCQSGARTRFNAGTLDQVGGEGACIMEGGIMAWHAAGHNLARR